MHRHLWIAAEMSRPIDVTGEDSGVVQRLCLSGRLSGVEVKHVCGALAPLGSRLRSVGDAVAVPGRRPIVGPPGPGPGHSSRFPLI
jgi:hypothetical protein